MSKRKVAGFGAAVALATVFLPILSQDRAGATGCVMDDWSFRASGPDALDLNWQVHKGGFCKAFVSAKRGGTSRLLSNYVLTLKPA